MRYTWFRQKITIYKSRESSNRASQFKNHENLQIENHNVQISRIFRQKITMHKSRESSGRTSQFANHENLQTEHHKLNTVNRTLPCYKSPYTSHSAHRFHPVHFYPNILPSNDTFINSFSLTARFRFPPHKPHEVKLNLFHYADSFQSFTHSNAVCF